MPRLLSKLANRLSNTSLNSKDKDEASPNVQLLLHKYKTDEERFLGELKAMRESVGTPASSGEQVLFSCGDDEERFGSRPQSRLKAVSRMGECASPQSDLLGSFCHLMNYVVHLRRQNRHLQKQVACLTEMREIEQLKHELLSASCSCQAPTDPSPHPSSGRADASGAAASRQELAPPSRLPTMRPRPDKSALPRPVTLRQPGPRSPIRDGAREALATPPSPVYAIVGKKDADPMLQSSCSADLSSAGETSSSLAPPPLPPRLHRAGMGSFGYRQTVKKIPEASDSDEQPVFSEVCLPVSPEPPRNRRSFIRRSQPQASSPNQEGPPSSPSLPGSVGSKSSLLQKLGLRKKAHKTSSEMSMSICSDDTAQTVASQESSVKAFIKKRKRKVSESDSLASSEASGKYKTIQLPQLAEHKQPTAMAVTVESIERNLSPEYVAKMQQWQQKRSVSLKGETAKSNWLRKPKVQRVETEERYFERDEMQHGRQNTVIYVDNSMVEDREETVDETTTATYHTASDTRLNNIDAGRHVSTLPKNGYPSPLPGSPKKSLSVTLHDPKGGFLMPKTASSGSLAASFLTLSDDSVFASQDLPLDSKACQELIGHLVTLQDKNTQLFKELQDKSSEYECITEQLTVLEREVRALKGRYRLDAAIERFTSNRRKSFYVPGTMLSDLESRLRELDNKLRQIKDDTFKIQQEALEAYNREQATGQKSLDQIEKLQNTNFQLLQAQMSQLTLYDSELQNKLNVLPSYDAMYSFVSKLLRKFRHLRSVALDKSAATSRLDLELLQTQTSLLLSHAQIERQKLELKQGKNPIVRCHSFHGQDLVERMTAPHLSFYLPFKLHGIQLRKHTEGTGGEEMPEESLESEFMTLFDNLASALNTEAVYQQPRTSNYRAPRPLLSSLHVLREGMQAPPPWRRPMSLIEGGQAPPPRPEQPIPERMPEPPPTSRPLSGFRLGNSGQVRVIASQFDAISAPNTPLARHVTHFGSNTQEHWAVSPRPQRTMLNCSTSDSSSGPDRHYDTPPCSFGYISSPSKQRLSDYSPVVTQRRLGDARSADNVQPYAMTRIPNRGPSGLQPPRRFRAPTQINASPIQIRQEGHYESLSSNANSQDRYSTRPAKSSSLSNRQEQRRQFLFGYQQSPPARPQSSAAVACKATSTDEAPKPPERNEKKRSSWIQKFKGKK